MFSEEFDLGKLLAPYPNPYRILRLKENLMHYIEGFFKKVKYGGGDNLTLFSRQTPPVSVQNAEKHLCSSEIRYG